MQLLIEVQTYSKRFKCMVCNFIYLIYIPRTSLIAFAERGFEQQFLNELIAKEKRSHGVASPRFHSTLSLSESRLNRFIHLMMRW